MSTGSCVSRCCRMRRPLLAVRCRDCSPERAPGTPLSLAAAAAAAEGGSGGFEGSAGGGTGGSVGSIREVFAGGLFSLLQFAASGGDHFGSQGRVEGCDGQRNRLRCELVAAIQEGGESWRNGAAFGLTIAFVTSGVEPCGGIRVFVEDSHHAQSLNGAEFAVVVILERTGVGLPGQLILANVDGFKEGRAGESNLFERWDRTCGRGSGRS